MQPQIKELLESNTRKETMYNHRKVFEQTCISCKIGWGVIFGTVCAFNTVRTRQIWPHLNYLGKGFNVALVVLFGFSSITQLQLAYVFYLGRTMQLVKIDTETKDELKI